MEVTLSEIKEKEDFDSEKVDQSIIIVVPGEVITTEQGFLKGHGVYVQDGKMIASVCGVVERVNKLISVRSLKSRYVPKIGDVVVARVVDLGSSAWDMDIASHQYATLSINSILLPGGEHRRRTDADILQMRSIFVENDLISAEVQQVNRNGSVSLHTRSPKYGKLSNGVLVTVPCVLIKRLKQHFVNLPCGVGCIFGYNGYVWVTDTLVELDDNSINSTSSAEIDEKKKELERRVIGVNVRTKISNVVASINYLKQHWKMISPDSIMEVYNSI